MAAHSGERQCAVNYLNGWLGTGQTTNIRSQPPATSANSRSTLQSCLTLSVTSKTVLLCCHLVSRSLARPLLGGLGLGLASVVFLLKSLLTTDGNSSVSRRQQITFLATLIFHLIDGLLSTTAAYEVRRRVGVLTCGSCHLEHSARQHPHRG